jgi:hypothetical protein
MELMEQAEQTARDYSPHIKQVDITYYDHVKKRVVANSNGLRIENELPLIWVVIEVLAEKEGVRHQGRSRISAHQGFEFFDENSTVDAARKRLVKAVDMLSARLHLHDACCRERGWGASAHEAVTASMGDFIYKDLDLCRQAGKKWLPISDQSMILHFRPRDDGIRRRGRLAAATFLLKRSRQDSCST